MRCSSCGRQTNSKASSEFGTSVTANSLHPAGFIQEDEVSPWMYHTQIFCAALRIRHQFLNQVIISISIFLLIEIVFLMGIHLQQSSKTGWWQLQQPSKLMLANTGYFPAFLGAERHSPSNLSLCAIILYFGDKRM